MATYKIKMDGNSPDMSTLSNKDRELIKKSKKEVSVKLSKKDLEIMAKLAGIKQGSQEQILKAYITKTLQDAEI